jgi:hypothetical protein
MVLTRYKSPEEIKHSLGDAKRVAFFSCAGCANMNTIGGRRGMKFLREQLEEWGYEVVVARTPIGCCITSVMEQAVNSYIKPNRSRIDALVQISCAAGMKNANYFNPGLRVVQAADPMGVETLLPHGDYYSDYGDNLVAFGLCYPCERCVLSFTTGICPIAECQSKSLYGFCDHPPKGDSEKCTRDPIRDCVWKIIEERGGDLEGLKELKLIHEDDGYERIPSISREPAADYKMKTSGFLGCKAGVPFADVVHFIR